MLTSVWRQHTISMFIFCHSSSAATAPLTFFLHSSTSCSSLYFFMECFFLSTFSLHHSKILAPFLLPLFTLQVPIKSKCKRNLESHWCHVLFLVNFIREELERHCEASCCLATGFSPVWDYDAGLTNASVFNGKDRVGKNGPARLLLAASCKVGRVSDSKGLTSLPLQIST